MIIPVVAAVIVDKRNSGRFLLTKHGECECDGCTLKDKYEFPGGKVKDGETLVDALIREVKEELNIDIYNDNSEYFRPAVIHAQINKYDYSDDSFLVIYFTCYSIDHIDESKLPEHVWVTDESIKRYDSLPGSVEALRSPSL